VYSAKCGMYGMVLLLLVGAAVGCKGQELDELRQRLAEVEAQDWDHAAPAYATNYPYARLQLRKAEAVVAGGVVPYYLPPPNVNQCVAAGLQALADLAAGKPRSGKTGAVTELAYITDNDRTAQPYHLYLPPAYDAEKATPLIVFLHGYVPTTSILDPWVLPEEVLQIAGKYGCMMLTPYARRNTDFQGVGEVDVFASLEEVKKLYNVDPRRIYLTGVSMGAMGAWTIALRHPGVFAAVTPISGQTDMYRWWGWEQEKMAPFKQWMVEWDNPWHLAESLRAQRFFVQHGENDHLIPSEQSRIMVQKAQELGLAENLEYYEYADASHFIYFETEPYEKAYAWQMRHTLDLKPKRIGHKTYSLEYGTAFWATIEEFFEWGKPATMDVEAYPDGDGPDGVDLRVDSQNVGVMSIDLAGSPLPIKESYRIKIGAGDCRAFAHEGRLRFDLGNALRHDGIRPLTRPDWKKKGMCGPCEEVFDTSFIVVAGTTGGDETDAELAAKVQRFSKEWDQFADGRPRVKLDTEITEDDIRTSNLVLFGTPETNEILGRIAIHLPIRIGDHAYKIGEDEYAADDLGLVMCYPNPLNPQRYVLIFSGEYWGERLDINHKFDMLPDFIVFTTRAFAPEGDTNEHLCAGFFDNRWELCEKLTWK